MLAISSESSASTIHDSDIVQPPDYIATIESFLIKCQGESLRDIIDFVTDLVAIYVEDNRPPQINNMTGAFIDETPRQKKKREADEALKVRSTDKRAKKAAMTTGNVILTYIL